MSERPKASNHGGYRPGSGRKSTLEKQAIAKASAPPASGVAQYMQDRALLQFDRIMDAWMAKAEGVLIAVYDLKEAKKLLEKGAELSGGVDALGKPVYVYRKEPETRALEWVSDQLIGKAGTKQQTETDNVYVINHSIPRPDYGSWQSGAAPPSAAEELLDSTEEVPAEPLDSGEVSQPEPEASDEPVLTKEQLVHKAITTTLMARMRGQSPEVVPEALLRDRFTNPRGPGPLTDREATPVSSQSVPDFIPDPAAAPSQPVAETPSHAPLKKFFDLPLK